MGNEVDVNVNVGPKGFAFTASLVLWILGGAAILWLTFYSGVKYIQLENAHERERQAKELRRNEAVGATPLPAEKIGLTIHNEAGQCAFVEKASIDGSELRAYYVNKCTHRICFVEFHWQASSPSGVVIQQGWNYENSSTSLEPGISVEVVKSIDLDKRVSSVRLFMASSSDICKYQ